MPESNIGANIGQRFTGLKSISQTKPSSTDNPSTLLSDRCIALMP